MVTPVVERRVAEERLCRVVVDRSPLEREEEELRLEGSRLFAEARDERASRWIGHVRREVEVRVGQRPDDRRLDPLELGESRGEP